MSYLSIIKNFLPPILLKLIKRFGTNFSFYGNYNSWREAEIYCKNGYNSELILTKVKDSLLKVKNGQAVYERDSVLFDRVEYSWPLLSCLLLIASRQGNKLNVLDFGGSLGSTYFQNRLFIEHLDELQWSIVEQESFVKCGKEYFEDEKLKFYFDIDSYLKINIPEVIILSSVLQYLEKPYDLLQKIKDKKFKYVIIDRTTFLYNNSVNKIVVQKVPASIYLASYPCWFFNESKLINFLQTDYKLIADFDALGGIIEEPGISGKYKGYFFELK